MKLLPVRARRLLSLPLRNVPIRIRGGPNEGRRWSLTASGRGVARGTYETERFEALARLVESDDVVWDVGAHYGYATLVASGIVRPNGPVLAFEPSTENRWYLERHVRWNGCVRVRVLPYAVAESDRESEFGGTGGSVSFRLGHAGERVVVRSITSLLRSGLPFPTFLKLDVEGAELLALEGAREALEEARERGTLPRILVSVHDPQLFMRCEDLLRALGYMVLRSKWIAGFLEGEPWREDPDLLALPPHRAADAGEARRIPWFAVAAAPT